MGDNHIAIQVHCLDQDRYNELLYNALLLVIDGSADVGASLNLVARERLVSDCLVVGH